MEEHVFFDRDPVKVTSARFIVASRTYAMNGVTSVESTVRDPDRGGPLVLIIIGIVLLLAAQTGGKVLGLALVAAGILIWMQQKSIHAVILHSASGQVQALSDSDEGYIGGVVRALNDALVHRG